MARQLPNDAFSKSSFLYGGNAAYVEQLYDEYRRDPANVDPSWRQFFEGLKDESSLVEKNAEGASWKQRDWPVPLNGELVSALDGNWFTIEKAVGEKIKARADVTGRELSAAEIAQATRDSVRAIMMIRAYRMRGHLHANLDPLNLEPKRDHEELHPSSYGFTEADYDRKIFIDNVLGYEFATLREMLAVLERTYCSTIGYEFMHISNPQEKGWLQERIEGPDKEIAFTPEGKRAILNKLVQSEGFEKFGDLRYRGTKRFGLDGAEAMVPALEQIIKRGGALGVREIVLGMPHRGRLNVLANVMHKPTRAIFHEFKGGSFTPDEVEGSGDVKYHLGASSDREFDGNKVHLSLTANPSHLEIVDPVVLGKVRAKQDQHHCPPDQRIAVMPLLIHGDAAFAGQGVVAECFGLSGLKGHRTGGSVHFIINNQLGFTTYPRYSRSSPYPSDVAKMVEAPIFHVNGDDPEAVVFVAKIATEYRQRFQKPVVIDMFCYRRFGHNEGDEPAFTQPLMYKTIRAHKTALAIYAEKLVAEGVIAEGEVEKLQAAWRQRLDEEFEAAQSFKPNKADWLDGAWSKMHAVRLDEDDARRGRTGVERRDAAPDRRAHHQRAEGLCGPQDHPALPRQPARGAEDRQGHRLGNGRIACLRLALPRRPPGSALGPGQRARHLLAAPQRAHRSEHRGPFHAAQPHRGRPGALRGDQLDALGRGGARLRIRLFALRAQCLDALGSPVRRFRQWRAGRLRPVHILGRA